jgi:hypothetical protein
VTSSRRNSRSSEAAAIALVRSAGSVRRSRTLAGSVVSQPRRRANAVNERNVATWRFQVAGAHCPHAAAVNVSRVAPSSASSARVLCLAASRLIVCV